MKNWYIIISSIVIMLNGSSITYERTYSNCGPISLEVIAKMKGIKTTVDEINNLSGFSEPDGTTLLGLKYAAERLGLPSIIAKVNKSQLSIQNFPIIAFVDSNHFLIIHGCKWFGRKIVIQESDGEKQTTQIKQLTDRWNGEVLLFSEKLKNKVDNDNIKEMNKKYFGPHIFVDDTVRFYGTVDEGRKISGIFKMVNNGSDTLSIVTRPSCSCTSAMVSGNKIPPGDNGEIRVEFNTIGRRGPQKVSVDVSTNDPRNPFIKLTIAATIQTGIKITPNRIWIDDIGQGKTVTREVNCQNYGSS
jgi:hypothetical protein